MTKEQLFFIQILNDFINQKSSILLDNLDLDKLKYYAKIHEVSGIVFYQTKLEQFRSDYLFAIYSYTNRQEITKELTDKFDFPWFVVKGLEVAKMYPIPELRTMGDCDLVVHRENRETVHQIMLNLNFENATKYDDREWQYYKHNLEFEIHDKLIYSEVVNNSKQEMFFNDFWKYVDGNELDWNFHFLYLVAHLRKHFMNQGSGIRPFMDLALVVKSVDLDWEWIENSAQSIELMPFLKATLAFCKRWFSIDSPISDDGFDDSFYMSSAEKIFDDGIFGFDNTDNSQSDIVNLMHNQGRQGVLKKLLKEFFPPYKSLISSEKYKFLKGRKYLLSYAWLYRLLSEKNKISSKINNIKKHYSVNENKVQAREELYSKWGL
jgi:hypothetical protein